MTIKTIFRHFNKSIKTFRTTLHYSILNNYY